MKLIVQPDAGIGPVLNAIRKAKTSIDIVIFRLDIEAVPQALAAAVTRGVSVRALVSHTNRGGEKGLRKLELRMLGDGVTVSRSADDLVRYHSKILIIDNKTLLVNGFNCTRLDVEKSRSFGVVTTNATVLKDAIKLFQADSDRQPVTSSLKHLVVSPDNSRELLSKFIKATSKQLLIYDPDCSDPAIGRLIADLSKNDVDVRIIGKSRGCGTAVTEKYPGKRLHVRAMIRDGTAAFVGSQSLRRLELDVRREVGVIIKEKKVIKQMADVFEADWAMTPSGKARDERGPDQEDSPSKERQAAAKSGDAKKEQMLAASA